MPISTIKTYPFKAGFGEAEVVAMREGVARQLHQAGVPGDNAYAMVNVLDEFCCNMMEHARTSWIEIDVEPRAHSIHAAIRDDGVEFDPTVAISHLDPDQPAHVSDRRLGLFMIGLMAKDMRYRRESGVNHLEFSLKRD